MSKQLWVYNTDLQIVDFEDWMRPATPAEIDEAAGVVDLRAELAASEKTALQFRVLSDAQQEVINEQREKLAATTEQRDKLLTAAKEVINELMGYTVWSPIDYERILMPLIAAGGDK
jgi:hypothetical protein